MSPPRCLALTILIVLLAGAGAAPALAGEYPVYACDPAAGDINRSWVASATAGMVAYAHCPAPASGPLWDRGLVTRYTLVPGGTVRQGAYAALAFTAPPGAGLSRITYTHDFCAWNGFKTGLMNAAGVWVRSMGTSSCGSIDPPQFGFALGGTNQVRLVTQCIAASCSVTGATLMAWASLRSATVWVADYTLPAVTITGGSGVTPGWKSGDRRASRCAQLTTSGSDTSRRIRGVKLLASRGRRVQLHPGGAVP